MSFISPFDLCDLAPDQPFSVEVWKRAKRKILAAFELDDGVVINVKGVELDKQTALALLEELNDPQKAHFYRLVERNRDLKTLLETGVWNPRLRIPEEYERNQAFKEWISQRYSQGFGKALSQALQNGAFANVATMMGNKGLVMASHYGLAFDPLVNYAKYSFGRIFPPEGNWTPAFSTKLTHITKAIGNLPSVHHFLKVDVANHLISLAYFFKANKNTEAALAVLAMIHHLNLSVEFHETIRKTRLLLINQDSAYFLRFQFVGKDWLSRRTTRKTLIWVGGFVVAISLFAILGAIFFPPSQRYNWLANAESYSSNFGKTRDKNQPQESTAEPHPFLKNRRHAPDLTKFYQELSRSGFAADRPKLNSTEPVTWQNGSRPYAALFKPQIWMEEPGAPLIIRNHTDKDGVIFIEKNNRLMDHRYIKQGHHYSFEHLNFGLYVLRWYSGSQWADYGHSYTGCFRQTDVAPLQLTEEGTNPFHYYDHKEDTLLHEVIIGIDFLPEKWAMDPMPKEGDK